MHRLLCVMMLAGLLAGCTVMVKTNAARMDTNKLVPKDRLFPVQPPGPGLARVLITRDTGFMGSACYLGITYNGQLIARIDTGETALVMLPPVAARLGVGGDPQGSALCNLGGINHTIEATPSTTAQNRFRVGLWAYQGAKIVALP